MSIVKMAITIILAMPLIIMDNLCCFLLLIRLAMWTYVESHLSVLILQTAVTMVHILNNAFCM